MDDCAAPGDAEDGESMNDNDADDDDDGSERGRYDLLLATDESDA